jgi:hypothetical protein
MATCDKLNEEYEAIIALDSNPVEALYKWIDKFLGIQQDGFGGALSPVDALPAYIDMKTARVYCTAIPLLRGLLPALSQPRLCGMAKYEVATGKFLEALLLKGWPRDMQTYLKVRVKDAYEEVIKSSPRMGCATGIFKV